MFVSAEGPAPSNGEASLGRSPEEEPVELPQLQVPVPHEGGVAYQMLLATSPADHNFNIGGDSPPEDLRVKKAAELPVTEHKAKAAFTRSTDRL